MTDTTAQGAQRPNAFIRALKPILLLRESIVGMIGAGIVVFWVLVAIFTPFLLPYDPYQNFVPFQSPGSEFVVSGSQTVGNQPASARSDICTAMNDGSGNYDCGTFWLGTDILGRDILSRIIEGSGKVLVLALVATFCAYLVGIPMGLWGGYSRGRVDDVLSFISNVILSFPVLVLYVLVITTVGKSQVNLIAAVVFASAPGIFRIVRGLTLDLRTREYVAAAETRGEPLWFVLFVEILPNARGPLIVDAMLRFGYVIITIGTLAFLGLGEGPPSADWGQLIADGRSFITTFPWVAIFPCLAISSLVLGFNLMADGLREISLRD